MNDLLERLRGALAGRYAIERELARGGMALVFLARDLRHNRMVAIKVMRPEIAAAIGPERFLREIGVVGHLQHPNILPLYDSGDAGGSLYYVMPYVEGESLRVRLEREGQLPIDQALQLAREVADALAFAHRHNVVHRDIKPENILLSDGHALVADFGIARVITAAAGERLTQTGVAVGTPTYMSPEQARGTSTVDGRADIYALGCVLYEMLAGAPPFTGPSTPAVLARHSLDPVPSLRTVRKAVPPVIERVVLKALEKAPADRFADAAQFAATLAAPQAVSPQASFWPRLRHLTAATVMLVVASGVWWALSVRRSSPRAGTSAPTAVAVLPFRNLGDSSDAYFAAGMAEELNNALVRIEGLAVRPQASVAAIWATTGDLTAVGRRLDAAYLVDGSLRRAGSLVRVTIQLVQVAGGVTAWSQSYNTGTADILAVQDSIAIHVATALSRRLTPAQRAALSRRGTTDLEAYDLYLQGKHSVNRLTLPAIEEGIQLYHRAIARDSSFAEPWAALAAAYAFLSQFGGLPPGEVQALWRRAAERALELDSLNGEAHTLRAAIRFRYDWDYTGADRDFRRAIALRPSSADAHVFYAQFLNVVGLDDSALIVMRRATALDPSSAFLAANLAYRLQLLGRWNDAAAETQRAVSLDSTLMVGHWLLADNLLHDGRGVDAARAGDRMRQLGGDVPLVLSMVPCYYVSAGRRKDATDVLAILTDLGRRQHVQSVYFAHVHLCLGDKGAALDALERAARDRDIDLSETLAIGWFDALRGDQRYEAIVARVGLPKPRR